MKNFKLLLNCLIFSLLAIGLRAQDSIYIHHVQEGEMQLRLGKFADAAHSYSKAFESNAPRRW